MNPSKISNNRSEVQKYGVEVIRQPGNTMSISGQKRAPRDHQSTFGQLELLFDGQRSIQHLGHGREEDSEGVGCRR